MEINIPEVPDFEPIVAFSTSLDPGLPRMSDSASLKVVKTMAETNSPFYNLYSMTLDQTPPTLNLHDEVESKRRRKRATDMGLQEPLPGLSPVSEFLQPSTSSFSFTRDLGERDFINDKESEFYGERWVDGWNELEVFDWIDWDGNAGDEISKAGESDCVEEGVRDGGLDGTKDEDMPQQEGGDPVIGTEAESSSGPVREAGEGDAVASKSKIKSSTENEMAKVDHERSAEEFESRGQIDSVTSVKEGSKPNDTSVEFISSPDSWIPAPSLQPTVTPNVTPKRVVGAANWPLASTEDSTLSSPPASILTKSQSHGWHNDTPINYFTHKQGESKPGRLAPVTELEGGFENLSTQQPWDKTPAEGRGVNIAEGNGENKHIISSMIKGNMALSRFINEPATPTPANRNRTTASMLHAASRPFQSSQSDRLSISALLNSTDTSTVQTPVQAKKDGIVSKYQNDNLLAQLQHAASTRQSHILVLKYGPGKRSAATQKPSIPAKEVPPTTEESLLPGSEADLPTLGDSAATEEPLTAKEARLPTEEQPSAAKTSATPNQQDPTPVESTTPPASPPQAAKVVIPKAKSQLKRKSVRARNPSSSTKKDKDFKPGKNDGSESEDEKKPKKRAKTVRNKAPAKGTKSNGKGKGKAKAKEGDAADEGEDGTESGWLLRRGPIRRASSGRRVSGGK